MKRRRAQLLRLLKSERRVGHVSAGRRPTAVLAAEGVRALLWHIAEGIVSVGRVRLTVEGGSCSERLRINYNTTASVADIKCAAQRTLKNATIAGNSAAYSHSYGDGDPEKTLSSVEYVRAYCCTSGDSG